MLVSDMYNMIYGKLIELLGYQGLLILKDVSLVLMTVFTISIIFIIRTGTALRYLHTIRTEGEMNRLL